jgi:hypothetical protein
MGRVAARTGNRPLVRIRRIILQQLCQRGGPGLMHGCSHSRLDRFQIEPTVAAALLKNNPQEPVYFAGDFSVGIADLAVAGL